MFSNFKTIKEAPLAFVIQFDENKKTGNLHRPPPGRLQVIKLKAISIWLITNLIIIIIAWAVKTRSKFNTGKIRWKNENCRKK